MSLLKRLTKGYGGDLCRYCINHEGRVDLQRSDCVYYPGTDRCPCCCANRHIVKKLKFSGKIKTMGK